MDLQKTIEALHAEKERIERVLAMLEELNGTLPIRRYSTGRRGRKSMPPEERALVSVRMKKYWARRRNDKITS